MACNDANGKGTLVSGSVNPTPQINITDAPKTRRYQRSKIKAPLADSVPKETIGNSPTPPKSIFGNSNPRLTQVAIILAVYLGGGTLCFYFLRHQMKGKKTNGIIDTVYFCVVTMATVGYGDLVPNSTLTKLLTCLYVFLGIALVGLVLSKGADYLVKKQENFLVQTLQNVGPNEIKNEVQTNRARNKCLLVFIFILVLIFSGTAVLVTVEKLSFLDAFYCVCVTMTTLGYGDESFKTKGGRLFAVFWIFMSTISLAQFFVCYADLKTEQGQRESVKRVLTRKLTNADMEAADLDGDGVVERSEFILFKLQEMGKITKDDISLLTEAFDKQGSDEVGIMSSSDRMPAHPPQAER